MTPEVQHIIDDARQRLTAIADDPPYRFIDTSRRHAHAYQQQKKTFLGYTEDDVAAAETRLGITFPSVFRAYLTTLGKARGDLFCGSDLVDVTAFEEYRSEAEELLRESNVRHALPNNAVVFLIHQGYTFAFIIADGGFDSPVYQYVEGDEHWSQSIAGFAEFIDAEIRLAEEVSASRGSSKNPSGSTKPRSSPLRSMARSKRGRQPSHVSTSCRNLP